MASTFWLSLCLVLFAYNLIDLLCDRHQLRYKIVEQGDRFYEEDNDLNYLVCTPFKKIKEHGSLANELEAQNVSVRSFLNHSIASIEQKLNVTGLIRLNESLIFNEHVCFPTNKRDLEQGGKPFNQFLGNYGTQRIFIYSKEKQPNFYELAYEKFDDLQSIYIRAYKQKVFGENYLLNADCSNRAHQIYHDRFSCLNRCFVEKKMKWAFYRFNDQDTLDLSEVLQEKRLVKREVNDGALKIRWKLNVPSNTEGVEECLKRCPERSCFWEVVITLKIDYVYYRNHLQNEGKDKVDLQLNTYAAFYSMNDFYLQLFSLLVLFTGTAVLRLLQALLSLVQPVTTRKIEPLLRNEKLLRIFCLTLRNLKHALTLLCFALVLIQGLAMVNEFRFHSSYPNRTSSLNFSSEPFSVVICFPLHEEDSLSNFSFNAMKEASNNLIFEKTEGINIWSGKKQFVQKFRRSDEVLFKISKFNDTFYLSRCFRVDLELDERLRKMPLAYLRIDFNTEYREIFLIGKDQNFTSGLVNLRGLYYPQKVTKEHSKSSVKSNCRDYSGEEGCGSRRNCLDRCMSTRFIEKHSSIPTNTVVSSNHLNPTMFAKMIKFNKKADTTIEEECSTDFNQTDCNEVYFEESSELVFPEFGPMVFIKMNYLNIVEREIEYDPLKTLLDIVGLETIFFGSNVFGELTTVLRFFCRSLRLKWRRAYSVFILLLASTGFLAHNLLVFRTIISGDLQENEFFEKPQRYTLPSPILCFLIKKDTDPNHRVTGEYLDDLTHELTFKQAFQKILYYNRTHVKRLDISKLNSTKSSSFYSSPELELNHFYVLGTKCFKTSLKVSYKEEDFFLQREKTMLQIYLDKTFANQTDFMAFIHQQADSREIGGGFIYKVGELTDNPNLQYSYRVVFELFRIVREDQFEQLKDPRRLFQEKVQVNDARTVETIRRRFEKEYNLTTNYLPLDGHFDLEVNNKLYEQYTKTAIDQSAFRSLDYEQNIANSYTKVYYTRFEDDFPHFSFTFSFLVRRVVITNRENYTKLVVSLLNTLSLWLDICVIDIGAWLSTFIRFVLQLHRRLIKTSRRLNRRRKRIP